MEKIYYDKPICQTRRVEKWSPYMYVIDSMLSRQLKYAVKDDEFFVLYTYGEVHHKIDDLGNEAYLYKPKICDEILAIYQDIKDLRRMDIMVG